MRYPAIIEAQKYSNELLPKKSDIYINGSSMYSNFKTLKLKREFSVPGAHSYKSGILEDVNMIWYTTPNTLNLYRYDTNTIDTISNFSTNIDFVYCFKPIKGIFNEKISFCLLVITESDIIIYGIESDSCNILNTDFSNKLYSKVSTVAIHNGGIYLGCLDGNVYQVIYKFIELFNYKYMNIYTPNSIIKNICNIFKRKIHKITDMSAGEKYLVSIGKLATVYCIEGGIYKIGTIEFQGNEEYVKVQIIEESPLLFCCIQKSGKRDFYNKEYILQREAPLIESGEVEKTFYTNPSKMLSVRKSYDSSLLVLTSFNNDQLRNFSKSRPVENYEILTIHINIDSAYLTDKSLIVLSSNKMSIFEILDSRRFLINCRTQEIYSMYKGFGDIEFMIKYFELLSENEDVSKIEGLCKNDNIKQHALFIFIYDLIKNVWMEDLCNLKVTSDSVLNNIVFKLKSIKAKLGNQFEEAKRFIDEFIQTNYYTFLLVDYGVSFKETFESILTHESSFRNDTLKSLLDICATNQSIDPLLKIMKNNCPIYLPLEQINMQQGLEHFKKGNKQSFYKSLEYFLQTKFDKSIIEKFNNEKFFYGSVYLIKEKFDFSFSEAVELFRKSVKCKKAFELGLADSREAFLYPFFEVITSFTNNSAYFEQCTCCENCENTVDLLKIENPMFEIFLKDKFSKTENIYNLYWKYLLYRNRRTEAAQTLISLSQRSDLDLLTKVNFLKTALSISSGTMLNSEIKLKLKLYAIQEELSFREKSTGNSLLCADVLYNDFCYKYFDLALKVLDAINFKDSNIIRNLFVKFFYGKSLNDCLIFLREISNKNLSLIIDLLVEKISESDDFCASLLKAEFDRKDIIDAVKNVIMSNGPPKIKDMLLRSLEGFADKSDCVECKQYCEKVCGIKVNK